MHHAHEGVVTAISQKIAEIEYRISSAELSKNRERRLDGNIAEAFFQAVLQQARERSLLSDEHFAVDGTLLEAWASVKSDQRKDAKNVVPADDPGNARVDFHGEKRSNETHESKTDRDAKMARQGKGKEAKVGWNFTFAAAAYNLIRMRNLAIQAP
jgi:hypothetical protein